MTIAKQDGICTLGCLQKVSTLAAAAVADTEILQASVFVEIFHAAVARRNFWKIEFKSNAICEVNE